MDEVKETKHRFLVKMLGDSSDKIGDRFPGFAWIAEVGDPGKGTVKYSEALGIHLSDKPLREEEEETLLYVAENLQALAKEVALQYRDQLKLRRFAADALKEMGNDES